MTDANLRHDLNNLLSSILTYAELLMQDLPPETQEYKFAEAIFRNGLAAREIMNPARPAPKEAVESACIRSGKILVVDDQPDMRDLISAILTDQGFEVRSCDTAQAALDILARDAEFSLVVTDQSLPGMTGTDLAAVLDVEFPGLPVMLVTGHDTGTLRPQKHLACIRAVIQKANLVSQLSQAMSDFSR